MKSFWIGLSLLVALSASVGCSNMHLPFRKSTPHQAQAPVIAPKPVAPAPVVIPAPAAPTPAPPAPVVPVPIPTTPKPKRIHARTHHAKPTKKVVTDSPTLAQGAAASPIGLLSAGDSSDNPALRQQTLGLISSTQSRLKTINVNVAASKQNTMAQIHLFLTQARQALAINDLQGANTLATKAKILVDELLR